MSDTTQRTHLPIPDPQYVGVTTYDAKDPDTSFPPIAPIRPPDGAPNVLVILIDDAGFGSSSAFGGPCATPNFEKLAAGGIKFTRFHTTALCSPTRAALLGGRNHHWVGMGGITEIATSAPGYNSMRPRNKAPLAEVLKLNGYSTAHFGKCHEVPVWETSPMGPFDRWPSPGNGFEHFYGFIGGETNQYAPALYNDTVPVEPDRTPEEGYHFTEDMTDRSIEWIRQQKALMPDKPFFVYYAPGATHAPHHVPTEWSDKYKGEIRRRLGRAARADVRPPEGAWRHPAGRRADGAPVGDPAWDEMPDDLKPVLARQMEVYAGFMEHTDHHAGRLIDALADLDLLDDTLIYVMIGDNGASAEGTPQGTFNELLVLNGAAALETTEFMASHIDDFGTPRAYNHYAVGWAHAMDTPYQWTKQVASHWGGTRNGTIVHWPKGITAKGEVRDQFHHVIDVMPTILEAAGIPAPLFVNGIQQAPLEGVSMVYTFDDATAADRHTTQYFEMFVNRGIYHRGWTAVTRHSTPWVMAQLPAIDDDVWELYGPDDWTQAHDLAAEEPAQLAKLQRQFLIEAGKYNVLPLDDRRIERFNPDLAGRPELIRGTTQLLFGSMGRLTENSVVVMKNKSYAVTAEIEVPERGHGTIVAQGGAFGGWTLYLKDGRPAHCYNLFGVERFKVYGADAIAAGKHQIRVEFSTTAAGSARAAPSRSSWTAPRPVRDAPTPRCRCSSRPTRRPISALTPAPR